MRLAASSRGSVGGDVGDDAESGDGDGGGDDDDGDGGIDVSDGGGAADGYSSASDVDSGDDVLAFEARFVARAHGAEAAGDGADDGSAAATFGGGSADFFGAAPLVVDFRRGQKREREGATPRATPRTD